jgi:hypothetical protein
MPQSVKVVRNTLSNAVGGTADFTSTGFGTPAAAIILICNANAANNPQNDALIGIGFWDGTNQRAVSVRSTDAGASSQTMRNSDDTYGALGLTATEAAYTVSSITDGIRLTLTVDATALERYCTVILLAGVSATVGTFTPNGTQNATQASGSLGHAPKLVFFTTIGDTVADRSATSTAVISFGFAEIGTGHRCILWGATNAAADEAGVVKYSEDRCVGQVAGSTLTWAGEVTAFGADTFTMTTRDGASGSDVTFFLSLGGADLSYDFGTLTTPTSTGNDVVATDIAPDALLTFLSMATSTTIATDSQANGLALGAADDNGQFSHNQFVEDAAATMNSGSAAQAAALIDLDSSAAGARTDLIDGTVTLNSSNFTINYSAVSASARKGWWVAWGTAAAGGNRRRRVIIGGGVL